MASYYLPRHSQLARSVLYTVSILGFFALLVFPISTGLFSESLSLARQHRIGSRSLPYNTVLSGWERLDDALNGFTTFFYDLSEGAAADTTLLLVPFVGSAIGILVLGMVESRRSGNIGKLPSFFTTMAMLGQLLGLGFVSPAFLGLCLEQQGAGLTSRDIAIDPEKSYTIPLTIVLGFGIPSLLAALPAPSLISVDLKVQFVRIWEIFPIAIYLVRRLLQIGECTFRTKVRQGRPPFSIPHGVYAFGFVCSALSYVYFWSISLTAYFVPFLFRSHIALALDPVHLVRLVNPFVTNVTMPSLSEGILQFVQWDLALISIAHLIWALALRLRQLPNYPGRISTKSIVARAILCAVILGPVSSAILMVWERDVEVLGNEARLSREAAIKKRDP
ncbi:uncharacterized protein ATNIH1004_003735 [Aspergillus tanneri]|uniref:Uncharacterized protein n=1 Tax=Aspergillus tanneri TaxID=1220188 RepID=A0A5M9MV85_9EURO|nr:uncharacterized protein ATNIH1004_003735 [Aspergillus tanneri]KAA8651042.1 hypothetical protein ATNIH1004_003735 [Aspergillus tanneri]